MEFKDIKLSKQLQNALTEMSITTATPIQEKANPVIMSGKDVVGIAQTGTGKTLAFGIPLIHKINPKSTAIQGLILSPTRELGQQIANNFLSLQSIQTRFLQKLCMEEKK